MISRLGVWWCAGELQQGRWGGVMALNDSCEAGAAIAGVVGAAGGVRAAYTALGRAPCIVITQSQAVGGEDRLPDC